MEDVIKRQHVGGTPEEHAKNNAPQETTKHDVESKAGSKKIGPQSKVS